MKILVCDKMAREGIDKLSEAGEVVVSTGLEEAQIVEAAQDAAAIIVRSASRITAPIIEAAKQLRVIGRVGVGVDNIDVEAATKAGVIVVNSPEGNTIAAAEHTIALMMSTARRIPLAHSKMVEREWAKSECMGTEVRDKTLGVIGLGRIGGEVAKRARGLDMRVIAHDPGLSASHIEKMGIEPVGLDELLGRSDFVTIHVPGAASTKGLINAEALGKMKKTAFLINCSRGGVVDEAALAKALADGVIAGAAIDVYENEPKPWDSPLLDAPSIVLTPHLGASTTEAQVIASLDVAEQICEVLAGGQARSAVNLPRIPEETAVELRPWVGLSERMGALMAQLDRTGLQRVSVESLGELRQLDCSLLTRAALVGLLSTSGWEPLNLISSPAIAAQRGVEVSETKSGDRTPYHSVIRIVADYDDGQLCLSGTLRGLNEPRVVRIDTYTVDFVPQGAMLLLWYQDRPGVIGAVGTIMGEAGVNIGQMHVGRTEVGGTALMILNLDHAIPPETAERVRALPTVEALKLVET